MEIKEAIEQLRTDISLYETDVCKPGDGTPDGALMEALQMAISALEKQEGKKPLQACGHATETFKEDIPLMNYCPICGQKILWER